MPEHSGRRFDVRCNCENSKCEQGHEVAEVRFEQCANEATVACDYIGGICGECAEFMPDVYLHGTLCPAQVAREVK